MAQTVSTTPDTNVTVGLVSGLSVPALPFTHDRAVSDDGDYGRMARRLGRRSAIGQRNPNRVGGGGKLGGICARHSRGSGTAGGGNRASRQCAEAAFGRGGGMTTRDQRDRRC
jgi:hypothetical protein